jgi:hypothetical protein
LFYICHFFKKKIPVSVNVIHNYSADKRVTKMAAAKTAAAKKPAHAGKKAGTKTAVKGISSKA